jgi:hypothetical protein
MTGTEVLVKSPYSSSIPADAREVVEYYHANGTKKAASYFVGPEKVGFREWYEDGRLDFEYALRRGVKHGNWYSFYPNGQLEELQPYCDGHLHGTGKQWAEDGQLLVTWKLDHTTGLDLWCDHLTGTLAEEHYWPRVGELGYKRQWNADEETVWEEYHYCLGYHGIWREWNARGRLRRGFPRFYVNNVKVTKRQYLRACEAVLTLLPYRPQDDSPQRELPLEYVRQKERRRK